LFWVLPFRVECSSTSFVAGEVEAQRSSIWKYGLNRINDQVVSNQTSKCQTLPSSAAQATVLLYDKQLPLR
jgi:hypothetical protein